MTIPTIKPYPMPSLIEPSVAGWRLEPDRALLLIHDMQNYFVDFFPSGEPPVVSLLDNVARLRDAATAAGVPVVYSAQPGPMSYAERGLLRDVWGSGMGPAPRNREIAAPVAPGPGHVVLEKRRYSAFHGTGLADLLQRAGRDQLIVCGVYAHVGCLMTAADAFARDIETFLVSDAVADFSAEDHRMAVTYAARRCAVAMSTEAVRAALDRR